MLHVHIHGFLLITSIYYTVVWLPDNSNARISFPMHKEKLSWYVKKFACEVFKKCNLPRLLSQVMLP